MAARSLSRKSYFVKNNSFDLRGQSKKRETHIFYGKVIKNLKGIKKPSDNHNNEDDREQLVMLKTETLFISR